MTTPVVRVPVVRVRQSSIPLPAYMSPGAAGLDLAADVDTDVTLRPGQRTLVPTGLSIALPAGYEGQVRPRSGLAHKTGVTVLNAPGTIDSDYRGEVQVLLVNLGDGDVVLRRGDRIAQLVVAPVTRIEWVEEATLVETDRGAAGFGSTGRR
jgi:dUTP pyrophosphatase